MERHCGSLGVVVVCRSFHEPRFANLLVFAKRVIASSCEPVDGDVVGMACVFGGRGREEQ